MWRKNIYFARFSKIVFLKIKSSKIDQCQLGYDFLGPISKPRIWMCIAQMKLLILANDSSHQYFCTEIDGD